MLVLSRYRDESIYIGDDIVITVVDIRGDRVRIGVQAPPDVTVHRQEVYDAIKNGNRRDSGIAEPLSSVLKPTSAPLEQELNKRKAKITNGLPVNLNATTEFGGLTSDSAIIQQ